MSKLTTAALLALLAGGAVAVVAQSAQLSERPFSADPDHPAIEYTTRPARDPVALLKRRMDEGTVVLKEGGPGGYLRSLLEVLDVPIESQLLVMARGSVQSQLIDPGHPRSLYFNDAVVVGWVQGGFIEFAAADPEQGVNFYVLDRGAQAQPVLRRTRCLSCHLTRDGLDVPGLMVRSIGTAADGTLVPQAANSTTDHRTPFAERWSGFYVTGRHGSMRHLGNAFVFDRTRMEPSVGRDTLNVSSLAARLDTQAYLSPHSDIVALMVFEHQAHMINLLTRVGWEARVASHAGGSRAPAWASWDLQAASREVVDYLLFVDEAPLASPVTGTSGFAEKFAARGPKDSKGRSLRDLDLRHRLMRYPCSYLIYSAAFDALPPEARDAVYRRLWQVLSGQGGDPRYLRLSSADRRAIVEILRETKNDLPAFFR